LDPIDDTKGFLRGGHYAIALALIEAGEVKLGLLVGPASVVADRSTEPGVLFTAVHGQGTWIKALANDSGREDSNRFLKNDKNDDPKALL
jgi:3'(2'), 5'-bisphosphate nucleotidase